MSIFSSYDSSAVAILREHRKLNEAYFDGHEAGQKMVHEIYSEKSLQELFDMGYQAGYEIGYLEGKGGYPPIHSRKVETGEKNGR
jgi:hypothetical protein